MLPELLNVETVEATEVLNPFNWDVQEKSIYLGNGTRVPNHKVLQRSDNGMVLNVCKDSYTPTTNELFASFVYKLQQITGYTIKSFDEFQDGKKVLAFLEAPETSINGWKMENYIAVGNAHDSSKAFFVANTNHMIRCQNQFSYLNNRGMKAFHTTSNADQIKQIENSIHLYDKNQKTLMNNFQALSARGADAQRTEGFIRHMFELENDVTFKNAEEKLSSRKLNQISDLLESIETEASDLGQTDFALFNGVTRWTTHTRTQKNKTFGNLFGSNALLNDKALTYLLN
jgi:hypothetical protein